MWFFSRCISIDSLNTCFQQQKNKSSYDFCLCAAESSVVAKRNDEDEYELSPKKAPRDHRPEPAAQARRRIPKRYSDIVGPSGHRAVPNRRESLLREKPATVPALPDRRSSLKPAANGHPSGPHHPKHRERLSSLPRHDHRDQPTVPHRYNHHKHKRLSSTNAVDILAHRMQAAMSTELMHSLDRNFVFSDRRHAGNHRILINRSQSFNQSALPSHEWLERSPPPPPRTKQVDYQIIPRVKHMRDDGQKSIETIASVDELTPDYDEDVLVRAHQKDSDDEEPMIDYDDSMHEHEEQSIVSPTMYELDPSSSVALPEATITPTSAAWTQEPTPLLEILSPLPSTDTEPMKKVVFRYQTSSNELTSHHKQSRSEHLGSSPGSAEDRLSTSSGQDNCTKPQRHKSTLESKPSFSHLSKDQLEKPALRKVSHPVSRSYSSYGSVTQLNERDTEFTVVRATTVLIDDDPPADAFSSSASTSLILDREHKSSSKLYYDYKRRASLITVPSTNTLTSTSHSHSATVHPIHTHIEVRSTGSLSSANDSSSSNKQINLCVINQLNEHLSTRLRHQQPDSSMTSNAQRSSTHQHSYDPTSTVQSNVYDEPNDLDLTKVPSFKCSDLAAPSVPPPPPPLPVGGFRPLLPYVPRACSSQRTSILSVTREGNGSETGCATGTSTISSKLSDTRILRELRTNPLFTKAKEHLELEPGSNGRRSGRRLAESVSTESRSYFKLEYSSKSKEPQDTSATQPDQLAADPPIKRTKPMNSTATGSTAPVKPRPSTKSLLQTPSELEMIFQKRAQRSEQNLT